MGPDPRNTNLITNHSTTTTTPNNMSRALKIGGGVVAVGAGYYFYRAGGDATAAKKRFEADATKVKHIGKEDISGKGTEIRKDAEVFAADAGGNRQARCSGPRWHTQGRPETRGIQAKG